MENQHSTSIHERLARIEVNTEHVKDGLESLLLKFESKLDAFDTRITRLERAWIYAGGVVGAVTIYFNQIRGLLV